MRKTLTFAVTLLVIGRAIKLKDMLEQQEVTVQKINNLAETETLSLDQATINEFSTFASKYGKNYKTIEDYR